MSIMSFLSPPKKAGDVRKQIDEMTAALAKLIAERRELDVTIEAHDQKRGQMLLSSASEEDILALDRQCDLAKLRSERLGLAQFELENRIESARDKAERERLASEHERAAGQIETATKALEASLAALAVAFAELVKAIPAETFLRKYSDRHVPPQQPASPEDVARAILANALYVAEPEIFETQKQRSAFAAYGAGVERVLSVYSFGGGAMLPRNHGLNGEECEIHSAPIAADKLIVGPLRDKARTLREGVAERLEAAE